MHFDSLRFTFPDTVRIIGAPLSLTTLQPAPSMFSCSPLQSRSWQTPALSTLWCLFEVVFPSLLYIYLFFFPLPWYIVRWFLRGQIIVYLMYIVSYLNRILHTLQLIIKSTYAKVTLLMHVKRDRKTVFLYTGLFIPKGTYNAIMNNAHKYIAKNYLPLAVRP